jgi:hypothetical protein
MSATAEAPRTKRREVPCESCGDCAVVDGEPARCPMCGDRSWIVLESARTPADSRG